MLKLGSDFGTRFEHSDIRTPDDIPSIKVLYNITNNKKIVFMFMKHYVPNRCEPRTEVIVKIPKKKVRGGGCEKIGVGGGGGRGWSDGLM